MSSATTRGEAYFLGKRAVDDRDSVALDELIAVVRESHQPEVRGIAALYLGAIEWDDRPVVALSRLLADSAKVSLQKCADFTNVMNRFKIYDGKIIPPGLAVATLATQNAGDISAPIEKVAMVALNERAGRGKTWRDVADPEALLELLTTDRLPLDPDPPNPAARERDAFMWRNRAANVLFSFEDHLRSEHIPALVALAADWWRFGRGNTGPSADTLLKSRTDLWTADVIAAPMDSDNKHVRGDVAQWLTRMAKRADETARVHLETLALDADRSVAKKATKGLGALDKAKQKH